MALAFSMQAEISTTNDIMKTIKLFFSTLLVVIISAIGMVSCNDDDEFKDKVVVIRVC